MPLDAVCLAGLVEELRGMIVGARIEKVQQPERDMLLFTLHIGRENASLLLSAGSGSARVHLTRERYEQPAQPPMFCMLLRKHLTGARITEVSQPPFERILRLELDALDELGATVKRSLIAELIGNSANLILLDADGRIIDCLRRVGGELSDKRQVLPGLFYRLPPEQEKPCFFSLTSEQRKQMWEAAPMDMRADKWLLGSFSALSPLVCRELCFRAFGEVSPVVGEIEERSNLPFAMDALAQTVEAGEYAPTLLIENAVPKDLSFLAIGQYGTGMETERCESFSTLLDAFYGRREKALRMQRRAQDLTRTVKTALDRLTRKLALQREELRRTGERETFRRRGDLITANMWRLEKGARVLECEDYYQEDCPTVEIPLDPLKTPQQNAAKYYKEYNKLKAAETHLTAQIEKGEKELDYLYSVLDLLSRAESEKDLSELRRELTETGYLRAQKQKKKEKPVATKPLRFLSAAGLQIAVGRNNAQNDRLTLHDARRTDYWFHTQKIHGSHVILRCEDAQPDEQSVHEAALLAAWYSQGRMSGKVAVDYTMVRFVRKPAGALPGKVIYTDYRTIFVEPTEAEIEALRRLS